MAPGEAGDASTGVQQQPLSGTQGNRQLKNGNGNNDKGSSVAGVAGSSAQAPKSKQTPGVPLQVPNTAATAQSHQHLLNASAGVAAPLNLFLQQQPSSANGSRSSASNVPQLQYPGAAAAAAATIPIPPLASPFVLPLPIQGGQERSLLTPPVFRNTKLRSGKWLREEEAYGELLIDLFEKGHISDCANGTTLRSYLSQKLHCAPMRISKKYAGRGIGKMVYLSKKTSGICVPPEQQQHFDSLVEATETKFLKAASPTSDFLRGPPMLNGSAHAPTPHNMMQGLGQPVPHPNQAAVAAGLPFAAAQMPLFAGGNLQANAAANVLAQQQQQQQQQQAQALAMALAAAAGANPAVNLLAQQQAQAAAAQQQQQLQALVAAAGVGVNPVEVLTRHHAQAVAAAAAAGASNSNGNTTMAAQTQATAKAAPAPTAHNGSSHQQQAQVPSSTAQVTSLNGLAQHKNQLQQQAHVTEPAASPPAANGAKELTNNGASSSAQQSLSATQPNATGMASLPQAHAAALNPTPIATSTPDPGVQLQQAFLNSLMQASGGQSQVPQAAAPNQAPTVQAVPGASTAPGPAPVAQQPQANGHVDDMPDFLSGFDKVAGNLKSADSPPEPASTVAHNNDGTLDASPPFTSRSFDEFHRLLGSDLTMLDETKMPDQEAASKQPAKAGAASDNSAVPDTMALFSAESYAMFAQESAMAASQHAAYLNDHGGVKKTGKSPMFDVEGVVKLVSEHVPAQSRPRASPTDPSSQTKNSSSTTTAAPALSVAVQDQGQPGQAQQQPPEQQQRFHPFLLRLPSNQGSSMAPGLSSSLQTGQLLMRSTSNFNAPIVSGSELASSATETESSLRGSTSESNNGSDSNNGSANDSEEGGNDDPDSLYSSNDSDASGSYSDEGPCLKKAKLSSSGSWGTTTMRTTRNAHNDTNDE